MNVGKRYEFGLAARLKKNGQRAKRLGGPGQPDIILFGDDSVSLIECKTTTTMKAGISRKQTWMYHEWQDLFRMPNIRVRIILAVRFLSKHRGTRRPVREYFFELVNSRSDSRKWHNVWYKGSHADSLKSIHLV